MLVISFSQEREDIKVFISEHYHERYYQELIIYSFPSDEEDIEILKYLILQMGIKNQEPLESTMRELRQYLDVIVPRLRGLETDIDMLDFSKLVKYCDRSCSAFNIDSMEDKFKYPIPQSCANFNNIDAKEIELDAEYIDLGWYIYPKTDEKVVVCLIIKDFSELNYFLTKVKIHISNWRDFIHSPISNYQMGKIFAFVDAFVFPNDCPDEMIVEEIRKYFSISSFEKMYNEEPSNPLYISESEFTGYRNPITLSR